MASQKISQFTAITSLASGDYFPVIQASGVTNKRVEVGVFDVRYTLAASGVAAQDTANQALSSGVAALASGNAALINAAAALASGNSALISASSAQASGNAALLSASLAQASGNAALASGNAALSSAATKLPLSGGVVSGQFAQNIVSLGLNGSGINAALGNYFTATLSGNSSVVISGSPSSVAYGFAYEVNHQTGTISWPTAVKWPSNTAPTLTTNKTHIFMFVTDDSGSTWRASSLVDYVT